MIYSLVANKMRMTCKLFMENTALDLVYPILCDGVPSVDRWLLIGMTLDAHSPVP